MSTQNGLEFKLDIADAETAKFFLGLPATSVSKWPFATEVFKSDRHGFQKTILCAEGSKWQQQRKRLSKMLHLDILLEYIEPMDISAIRFCEELCKDDAFKELFKIYKLDFFLLNRICKKFIIDFLKTGLDYLRSFQSLCEYDL